MTPAARMMLFRLILAAIWIGLGVILFVSFRGHTLLIDNKSTDDINDPGIILVSLDGKKADTFLKGDRDRYTAVGPHHRIRVEFTGGGAPFECVFALPVKHDMYLLSIPKMLSGITPFVEPFITAPESRSDEPDTASSGG